MTAGKSVTAASTAPACLPRGLHRRRSAVRTFAPLREASAAPAVRSPRSSALPPSGRRPAAVDLGLAAGRLERASDWARRAPEQTVAPSSAMCTSRALDRSHIPMLLRPDLRSRGTRTVAAQGSVGWSTTLLLDQPRQSSPRPSRMLRAALNAYYPPMHPPSPPALPPLLSRETLWW